MSFPGLCSRRILKIFGLVLFMSNIRCSFYKRKTLIWVKTKESRFAIKIKRHGTVNWIPARQRIITIATWVLGCVSNGWISTSEMWIHSRNFTTLFKNMLKDSISLLLYHSSHDEPCWRWFTDPFNNFSYIFSIKQTFFKKVLGKGNILSKPSTVSLLKAATLLY